MKKIFICYSHKDEDYVNQLITFFDVYEDDIDHWHDRRLGVGDEWKQEIIKAIDTCHVAILIVSSYFLTSKFIKEVEVPLILQRRISDGVGVFPFLVRNCDYSYNNSLQKLQIRPLDAVPLNSYRGHKKEAVLLSFAKEVRTKVLEYSGVADREVKVVGKTVVSNKSKPILDQIYDFVKVRYDEINYYPIDELISIIPFGTNIYYTTFWLSNCSEEIFNLFNSIQIEDDGGVKFTNKKFISGVENYEEKTKEILRRLTSNLVFGLFSANSTSSLGDDRTKEIRYLDHQQCNCVQCSYNRFDFKRVLANLDQKHISIEDRFKVAFFSYKVGDYSNAAKVFLSLSKECEGNLPVRYFITQYNLKRLEIFVRINYQGDSNKELIDQLENIEINSLFSKYINSDNFNFIKTIYAREFLSEGLERIHKKVELISAHYDTYKSGGNGVNNFGRELLNEYAQVYSFLNLNYIIYDEFVEFKQLSLLFIKGVIISHTMAGLQTGSLEKLDDFVLKIMVFYGSASTIKKYFHKYKVVSIKYSKPEGKENLLSYFENLIKSEKEIQSEESEIDSDNLSGKFNYYFSNFLVVFSWMEVSDQEVKKVLKLAMPRLKGKIEYTRNRLDELWLFIERKISQIESSMIKSILMILLKDESRFDAIVGLERMSKCIKNHGIKITLDSDETSMFIKFIDNRIENSKDVSSLFFVPYLVSGLNKDEINAYAKNRIPKIIEERFNTHLFYLSSMFDVIDFDKELLFRHSLVVIPKSKKLDRRTIFGISNKNQFVPLVQYLDLCYKYNVDTSGFNELKGIDDCYDWMLDMGQYDYSKFDPTWLEGKTSTLYEEVKKYPEVRKKLEGFLTTNRNERLERIYFTIYGRQK